MSMLLKNTTYKQQSLLAEYTRTGDEQIIHQLQGVKEKGIKYYRELIFNIVWDGITNAYPIMTEFLGEDNMKELVHRFFSRHKCLNPQVWAMPKEFMDYVNAYEKELINTHKFLSELMLFEWKEIELYMMPDKKSFDCIKKGSEYSDKLVINPEIEIIHLQYPVFLIHPEEMEEGMKGHYILLMHRTPDSKEVDFDVIFEYVEKFLKLLLEKPLSFREVEKKGLFTIQERNQLKEFISIALNKGILLGFLKQ